MVSRSKICIPFCYLKCFVKLGIFSTNFQMDIHSFFIRTSRFKLRLTVNFFRKSEAGLFLICS